MGDSKPLTASKGGVHRLRNRFGLKNRKITGKDVPADEEAAATSLAELKTLIRIQHYLWFQASLVGRGDHCTHNSQNTEAT